VRAILLDGLSSLPPYLIIAEFVTGEYNHLFSIHAVTLGLSMVPSWAASLAASYPGVGKALQSILPAADAAGDAYKLHLAAVAVFIIMGGILASLNHTRYDFRATLLGWEVRYHDIHHARNVRTNYSQYTMLWDRVFGTFLEYKEVPASSSTSSGGYSKTEGEEDEEPKAASSGKGQKKTKSS
jgi:sterol desaturase/sphingolipid hydroxylase (fatty acid hydroxylase superfamily)